MILSVHHEITLHFKYMSKNSTVQGFHRDSEGKNLPANAGDTGSIPDPGGKQQLGPCATATEPALYSPGTTTTETVGPRAHALHQEKPRNEKPTHRTREQPPLAASRGKPTQQ